MRQEIALLVIVLAAILGMSSPLYGQTAVYQPLGTWIDPQVAAFRQWDAGRQTLAARSINTQSRPQLAGLRSRNVELLEDAFLRKHPKLLKGSPSMARKLVLRAFSTRNGLNRLNGSLAEAIFLQNNPEWGYVGKPNAPQHDVYRWGPGRQTPFNGQVKFFERFSGSRYTDAMQKDYYIYYCKGIAHFKQERICGIANTDATSHRGDVIFIHGLDGDADLTWRTSDPQFFWPESLGKKYPDVGIWSVDYDACSSDLRGGTMPFMDRSKNLLAQLTSRGIGDRPLVFVGHSLGGILIKQMLRDAVDQNNPKWQGIATQTKAVVFLATPHGGSGLASLVTSLKHLAEVAKVSVSVTELERNAAPLRDLNVWYRNNIVRLGIETSVFYEEQPTTGIGTLVVDQGSADPGISGVTPIGVAATHISICKPQSEDDLVFRSVADLIATHLLQAPPSYNVSFAQFVEEFNLVRHDAAKLAVFKKEHVGRKVKWTAIIRRAIPDTVNPAYVIAPKADTPSQDHVLASFSAGEFETPSRENAVASIEGRIAEATSESGAVLDECRIMDRAPKSSP